MPDYGIPALYPEQEAILRRQKIAEYLMQKGMSPMDMPATPGRGYTPSVSPFEGLAQLAQAYVGKRQLDESNQQLKDLSTKAGDMKKADYQKLIEALQPTLGESRLPPIQGQPQEGPGMPVSVPASRQSVINAMLQMQTPQGQQMAGAVMPKEAPPAKWNIQEGQLLNENSQTKPDLTAIPQKIDLNKLIIQGPDGKPMLNQAYYDAELALKKAGANKTDISIGNESQYGKSLAEGMAKTDLELMTAAQKAPELANRANQVKELLSNSNVITGFGADFKLQFSKALQAAGLGDGTDSIKNTEVLAASLAQNTMDAIKASGMGGGTGFSNADRDFLEKAKGGKITLDAKTINRLADLAHRTASLQTETWNKRMSKIPKSASEATGMDMAPVSVPPLWSPTKNVPRGTNQIPLSLDDYLNQQENK
jgi:hypothetical protein